MFQSTTGHVLQKRKISMRISDLEAEAIRSTVCEFCGEDAVVRL